MRGTVTRRRGWQGFLDRFRSDERAGTPSPSSVYRSGDSNEAVADALFEAEIGDLDLVDFLAGDLDPVAADPLFREELREKLWDLVQDGAIAPPKNH